MIKKVYKRAVLVALLEPDLVDNDPKVCDTEGCASLCVCVCVCMCVQGCVRTKPFYTKVLIALIQKDNTTA